MIDEPKIVRQPNSRPPSSIPRFRAAKSKRDGWVRGSDGRAEAQGISPTDRFTHHLQMILQSSISKSAFRSLRRFLAGRAAVCRHRAARTVYHGPYEAGWRMTE
jgi:hypothetical protein